MESIPHFIMLGLLSLFILFDLTLPIKPTTPVILTLLLVVFYLFTLTPLLGTVALIALYQALRSTSKPTNTSYNGMMVPLKIGGDTLEETMVKRIVPLVQTLKPTS